MPKKVKNRLPVAEAGGPVPSIPSAMNAKIDIERERNYKAQNALSDIERAETHKLDKNLMKDVKKCAKDKMKALSKI